MAEGGIVGQVDPLLAAPAEELLDLITAAGEGGGLFNVGSRDPISFGVAFTGLPSIFRSRLLSELLSNGPSRVRFPAGAVSE